MVGALWAHLKSWYFLWQLSKVCRIVFTHWYVLHICKSFLMHELIGSKSYLPLDNRNRNLQMKNELIVWCWGAAQNEWKLSFFSHRHYWTLVNLVLKRPSIMGFFFHLRRRFLNSLIKVPSPIFKKRCCSWLKKK